MAEAALFRRLSISGALEYSKNPLVSEGQPTARRRYKIGNLRYGLGPRCISGAGRVKSLNQVEFIEAQTKIEKNWGRGLTVSPNQCCWIMTHRRVRGTKWARSC